MRLAPSGLWVGVGGREPPAIRGEPACVVGPADAIYVNAALPYPAPAWLVALRPGGRLVFPLHGKGGFGGMLRLTRPQAGDAWPARFISRAGFIPCMAPQDAEDAQRLAAAFAAGGWDKVRSFHRAGPPDDTSWFAGNGWWLSTAE